MKKIAEKWYLVLIIGFLVFTALVFGIFGKGSIISVHDNLDLFVAQFQMLKNTGAFWKHGVEVPFLGGISRDVLPSEFSLYSLLYMILPSYYAYVAGYLLKIVIGTFSMVLLARDLFKDHQEILEIPRHQLMREQQQVKKHRLMKEVKRSLLRKQNLLVMQRQ